MRTLSVCFAFCIFTIGLFAQEAKPEQKIPSTYDRSSITFLLLDFPSDNHSGDVKGKINSIVFADKYYNNNVSYLTLPASFSRTDLGAKITELVKKSIEEKNIPKDIISKWYSRKDDGTMSTELIEERGMFNATDAAFIKAQTTKRGNSMLMDYGNRLIERSYILVLDYKSVVNLKDVKDSKMKGWKSTVIGYLYKIDFNDEIQNAVYDSWIYEEDSPQVKAEKKQKFEQIKFPISFVTETSQLITASQAAEGTDLGKFLKQKSEDQLLSEMVQKGYDESLYFLEKKYEDFKVKTMIYQTGPVRAKIGKKEGLKTDYRFFAYEYVYNEKTNSTKQKFRGVIRATSSIVDNRQVATGDMGTTKFYQTAGQKLRTGYLLQQRNDFGIEGALGYEIGEVGGIYARIDARLGRYIGVKSLFLYLEGGAEMQDYGIYEGIAFAHYGGGLAKGFMLTKNVEIRPYIGAGQEIATHEDFKDTAFEDIKALYVKGGANVALNLKHNIQIFGGMGFYAFVSNAENKDGDTEKLWTDIFIDEDGNERSGASMLFGLRVGF
ncbi:MAG: hypothetical protein AB9846_08265 [Tenuifilaceae bacterium]